MIFTETWNLDSFFISNQFQPAYCNCGNANFLDRGIAVYVKDHKSSKTTPGWENIKLLLPLTY